MAGVPEQDRPPRWKRSRGLCRLNRFIPFLFLATVVVVFIVMMRESNPSRHIKYTTVTGFFQQDDPTTISDGFDYTTTNFGLIDQAYDTDTAYDPDHKNTQWERFEHKVLQLNREGGRQVQYKLLFMGRHGEGYHNAAESYYGTPAWDCYWSEKNGNGTVVWADAHLTPAGIAQAQKAKTFWASLISTQRIPVPETYYTSPLTRCLETASITFANLPLSDSHPFIPVIKELFREAIGVHTCDRRSSKTYIHENFPTFKFEEGFKESDPLWDAKVRESDSAQDERSREVLDDVFGHDKNTYISISSHSGEIGSILRVLGHRTFSLGTGQVIPVLVKAEVIDGTAPTSKAAPYRTISTCLSPPPMATL